uniref:Uncharacterized protein n=1 Tax=Vitis vinifera TaxID=29760 RepID=A5C7X5_VITVI|nr:hypothetical protein VITISV_011578 [Vitis vinifera]
MSVANIGKLQENTAKISQNVSRKYLEASGEHRGTVQNICETLRVSAQRIQICLTGEVETPSSPIWRQALDAKYLEKVCAGCETSGWNGGGAAPSGFSKRICGALPYPDSLMEKYTTLAVITPGR